MRFRLIALPFLLLAFVTSAVAGEAQQPSGGETSHPNWSGLYIGAHGGYGRSSVNWSFPFDEYYNTNPGQSFSTDPKGAIMGAHLALNYQFDRLVAGVEGSFSNTTLRQDRVGPVTPAFPGDEFKTNINDLATVSGRLGYARDKWLFYAKAGYASADVKLHALSGPPGPGVIATTGARQNGRIVGAGVEYMISPMLILGLEYNSVNLDAKRHSTTSTGTEVGLPVHIDSDDIALRAVVARVSIRLGDDRQELENLK